MADKIFGLCLLFCLANYCLAIQAPVRDLNDGNKIPTVALGTAGDNPEKARGAVLAAIEAGYRHIDTASIYLNEEYVGEGIADAIAKGIVTREDVFVTTKGEIESAPIVDTATFINNLIMENKNLQENLQEMKTKLNCDIKCKRIDYGLTQYSGTQHEIVQRLWNDRHDQVVISLRESLQRLGLKYVDLYLIHFPQSDKEDGTVGDIDYLDTWKGMEEAKKLGLAKSIGVSNFNQQQIERIIASGALTPAVNEIEVNPTMTQEQLVDYCKKVGVAVMAYSPFGFLVTRQGPDSPPPKFDDPVLVKMATKYGKSTAQVVLRYLVDRDLIPIPKSTNKKRIEENINIFDFKLTEDEIETINKFNKNISVISF